MRPFPENIRVLPQKGPDRSIAVFNEDGTIERNTATNDVVVEGEGKGLALKSVSPFAPSVKLINDGEGVQYPFAIKLYNTVSERTALRITGQQGSPTDNLDDNNLAFEILLPVEELTAKKISGAALNKFSYFAQDVDQTDEPAGGIQFVGLNGWALPAPTRRGDRLLICGADEISAPVSNNISLTNSGCTVTGVSHNGVAFSETVSLNVIGRCIELVGINTTTWRIVGTAPWTR